jgi:dipeptidase E
MKKTLPELKPRQIVAMGGGGFSMEPENPLLDQYVLDLCGKRKPRVCFVPTASGDAEGYISAFHASFKKLSCTPSHLSLFRSPVTDLRSFILSNDVIYVGGGNTFNLLVLWRAWGLDRHLKEAWRRGIVLAGISAGSLCWFEEGVTDSFGELAPLEGLGFLPGSHCPHYDGEKKRRPAFHRLVGKGKVAAGYAAEDGVGLHFIGRRLVKAVSSRPNAKGYWVEKKNGRVQESSIVPVFLEAGH